MKKEKISKIICLVCIILAVLFFSCSNDDNYQELKKPTIENLEIGYANNKKAIRGRDFHFNVDVVAASKIGLIKVAILPKKEQTYSSKWQLELVWDEFKDHRNTNVHKHFTIPENAPEGLYDFVFTVHDQNGSVFELKEDFTIIDANSTAVDPIVDRDMIFRNDTMIYYKMCIRDRDRQEIQPSLNQIKIFESLFVSQMHSSLLDKQEFKVYNDLNFLFDSQKGDFSRKQQGSQTTLYGVSSQGTKKWDKIYLKGNFNYNRIKQENVKFNASILDPFRGMPFIVADTNSSRWNKQQIDFNAQGILKVSNKMSLGLFTGFEVYSGAKQRDIRSENYRYKLQINPSLSYHLTNNSSISAELNYVSFKEESSNSNTNTYIDQPYYELYGLGHHVKAIGSGRTTNYFGNTLGTGINYLYKQKGYWLLFYGKTDLQVEDVEISFSVPKKDGTVKSRENKLGIFWGNTMDRYQSKVQLEYGNTNRKAIEYISLYDSNIDNLGWDVKGQFVFSSYKMDRIDLGVDYLTKESTTGDFINWFTIKLSYLNQKDKYLATGSKFYNSSGVGEFKYQRNLSVLRKKGELIASMGLKYKHSFSSDYKYNGGYPNSLVVTELMQNELQYIDSSYWRIAPEIIYSLKLDKNTSSIFYLKASYNYLNTNNKKLNTYSGLQFNVGFTF